MHKFRRTRIVATVGPASGSVAMLGRMVQAGVDIVRLNFSHGTYEDHADYIAHTRSAARRAKKHVAIMQDLQGPKIRIGDIKKRALDHGERVVFLVGGMKPVVKSDEIPIACPMDIPQIKKGDRILLNDGFVEVIVATKRGKKIEARVVQGGEISAHQGVHFPDSHMSGSIFTKKDESDLRFGLEQKVDYVALSFVETASEVMRVRAFMTRVSQRQRVPMPRLIAKIERKEAIEHFIEILPHVDGIMIARGDLGLDIPFEEVPIVQKELVELCRIAGKPVIVATHMLESMTKNIRPTRAEVSDVANAVIDHADAVMLSAETATGEHPYAVVQVMDRVVRETEFSYLDDLHEARYSEDVSTILAQTVHRLAGAGAIAGIAVQAEHGELLRRISMYRPQIPIYVFCTNEHVARQNMLYAGAEPIIAKTTNASFELMGHKVLLQNRVITKKERIAFLHQGTDGKMHLTIKG